MLWEKIDSEKILDEIQKVLQTNTCRYENHVYTIREKGVQIWYVLLQILLHYIR